MYKLLDCVWVVAMNADRGALYPVAAFGAHPEPCACASRTLDLLTRGHATAPTVDAPDESAPCATCSLLVHGRTAGVLALGPKRNALEYTPSDRDLLAQAAAHIGALLENERLAWYLAAKTLEAERARRELETAREVRNRFFPARFSAVQGIDYYGECEPGGEVGGDFYDFTPLAGNGLAMAIGGVSEHGVPAAIIVAALQAALRGISATNASTPAQVAAELNRLVCDLCPDNFHATLFYARIEPEKGSLAYVNAGHESALLLRTGARRVYRLNAGGTVLGLTRRSAYEQAVIPLEGGETLAAFTKGIAEEERGADGIASSLRAHPKMGARDLVMEIMRASGDFRGRPAGPDDRTAVAARIAAREQHTPLFAVAPWERERISEVVAA
jgi:sigma-B regulation protein RsbU (phosphoserine phosphatase)